MKKKKKKTTHTHLFEHIESKNFVVVHYLGDETVFLPVCIEMQKKKNPSKAFQRTCPSVFEEIKSKSRDITNMNGNRSRKRIKTKCRIRVGSRCENH